MTGSALLANRRMKIAKLAGATVTQPPGKDLQIFLYPTQKCSPEWLTWNRHQGALEARLVFRGPEIQQAFWIPPRSLCPQRFPTFLPAKGSWRPSPHWAGQAVGGCVTWDFAVRATVHSDICMRPFTSKPTNAKASGRWWFNGKEHNL